MDCIYNKSNTECKNILLIPKYKKFIFVLCVSCEFQYPWTHNISSPLPHHMAVTHPAEHYALCFVGWYSDLLCTKFLIIGYCMPIFYTLQMWNREHLHLIKEISFSKWPLSLSGQRMTIHYRSSETAVSTISSSKLTWLKNKWEKPVNEIYKLIFFSIITFLNVLIIRS